ncbi:Flightin [Lucilia cuprina]|nr:Flightin [Lucilia cuprina]
MGDEEDPWAIDETTETNEPQESSQQETLISQTEGVASDQTNKENVEDDLAPPPPPPEDDGYRKPVQLYRHWVRTNYYDDVIDYLDKKQVGVPRDIPRAQTWAERVLRTNYSRFVYKHGINLNNLKKYSFKLIKNKKV